MKPTKIHSTDTTLNVVQQVIADTINKLPNFLFSCQLIGPINLNSGDNTLSHGLNGPLQGWILVRLSASVTLYDKQKTNTIPNKTLVLNSSGAVTVTLIVF